MFFELISDDYIRLASHIAFLRGVYSFGCCVLVVTQSGNDDGLWIKTPKVFNYFTVKISLIFYFKHMVILIVQQFVLPIFSDGWEHL